MPLLDGRLKRKIGERLLLVRAVIRAVVHTTSYALLHRPAPAMDGDWFEAGLPQDLLCRTGTKACIRAIGALRPPEFDKEPPKKETSP